MYYIRETYADFIKNDIFIFGLSSVVEYLLNPIIQEKYVKNAMNKIGLDVGFNSYSMFYSFLSGLILYSPIIFAKSIYHYFIIRRIGNNEKTYKTYCKIFLFKNLTLLSIPIIINLFYNKLMIYGYRPEITRLILTISFEFSFSYLALIFYIKDSQFF